MTRMKQQEHVDRLQGSRIKKASVLSKALALETCEEAHMVLALFSKDSWVRSQGSGQTFERISDEICFKTCSGLTIRPQWSRRIRWLPTQATLIMKPEPHSCIAATNADFETCCTGFHW